MESNTPFLSNLDFFPHFFGKSQPNGPQYINKKDFLKQRVKKGNEKIIEERKKYN